MNEIRFLKYDLLKSYRYLVINTCYWLEYILFTKTEMSILFNIFKCNFKNCCSSLFIILYGFQSVSLRSCFSGDWKEDSCFFLIFTHKLDENNRKCRVILPGWIGLFFPLYFDAITLTGLGCPRINFLWIWVSLVLLNSFFLGLFI